MRFSFLAFLISLCVLLPLVPAWAQGQMNFGPAAPAKIHMVVFRGCEEACQGFKRFFRDRNMPVDVTVTNIARDRELLPGILEGLKEEKPDLVVTWGTTVTRAILGTREKHGNATALGDIPALFMIVADPVNADIIASYETLERPSVFGVRNRVPERTQLNTLFQYYFPRKLGVINNPAEVNSQINTRQIKELSKELGFELVSLKYTLDEENRAEPAEIPMLMRKLHDQDVDAVYVGSSSFNLQNMHEFTGAAKELGLPVFSAYEQMVRDSDGLMAVGSSYANVGKLAGRQAFRFLFEGAEPIDLGVATLDRHSIFINIRVARELNLFPPIQLLRIAEIVQ
ncbi:MAG: ABC transporter substrate-binding protein [Pseudomonadota bacterium]